MNTENTETKKDDVKVDATPEGKGPETKDLNKTEVEKKDIPAKTAQGRSGDRKKFSPRRKDAESSGLFEKVLLIKRITKVTKGGKKLSFSALVVVGDTKGKVGYSLSKAREVAIAIKKSLAAAKKNMVPVSLKGSTIPHEIIGVCGGATVLLKPASDGTGVIASGPVRAVCEGAGIHNILTKCHRSNNPINVVKATFNGFSRFKKVKEITPDTEEKEECKSIN